jgi:hypothetical protein
MTEQCPLAHSGKAANDERLPRGRVLSEPLQQKSMKMVFFLWP